MQCPNCSEKLPSGSTFCGMCGQKIEAPQPAPVAKPKQAPAAQAASAASRKGLPAWVWVLIGIGGVLVIGIVALLAMGSFGGGLPANDIAGTWSGDIASIEPGFSAVMTIDIGGDCAGDPTCGTYRVDAGPCTGRLRLSSAGGGGYWFEEIPGPGCSLESGWQFLRPLSGDRVEFNFAYSEGGAILSTGVLVRD